MSGQASISVLYLVDRARAGTGPHRHVVELLNGLGKRDDVRVRLLCGDVDKEEPFVGARNIDIVLGFRPHGLWPRNVLHNLVLLRQASRTVDMVYVPCGLKSLLYAQVARPKPIVAGPNITPVSYIWGSKRDAPGWIELSLLVDCWVEASVARRSLVEKETCGKYNEKLAMIHHGLNTDRFSPSRRRRGFWRQYGVPEDTIKVLYVGKDYPLKGVKQLIGAIPMVCSRVGGSRVSFVFVGNLSLESKSRLQRYDNVLALGFRAGDELADVYANSDILVTPSSWENCPFVILEGLSSGLAVVASKVGGILELIENERSGVLVQIAEKGAHRPDASKVLAEAIVRLVRDAEYRIKLGSEARQRAVSFFSNERVAEQFVRLFIKVLHRRREE